MSWIILHRNIQPFISETILTIQIRYVTKSKINEYLSVIWVPHNFYLITFELLSKLITFHFYLINLNFVVAKTVRTDWKNVFWEVISNINNIFYNIISKSQIIYNPWTIVIHTFLLQTQGCCKHGIKANNSYWQLWKPVRQRSMHGR